jgi:RNA polymerase sigma factor (sigma-70 family)
VLGIVTRRHCDFADAEDAVQDALLAAATQWPEAGVPDNPRGWLYQVAMRRLIDQARSDISRRERELSVARDAPDATTSPEMPDELSSDGDDTLLLLFMCCHSSLTSASAIALTLRAVGGLTTREIASAFLVPEATMAQRISRAKQAIKSSAVPFAEPSAADRAARLQSVLHVLYLIFNEGYGSTEGAEFVRTDLSNEAIRLVRALYAAHTDIAEIGGLLALMLLTDARRAARTDAAGELIPLNEQDRTLWDHRRIEEGVALISSLLSKGMVGPYQIQAAIAAIHDEAATVADTDWAQILAFYQLLERMTDNPMVSLNRAIAAAMVHGPVVGLAQLDVLADDSRIMTHYRLDAARAHLYEKSGDTDRAIAHFRAAAERTASMPERNYLLAKVARLLLVPFVLVSGIVAPAGAQAVENAAIALAQRWSGSNAAPVCVRAPAMSQIERQRAQFDCRWNAPRTTPPGSLTGSIVSMNGRTIITWQRPTLGADDATRVRDSLATALEANGLKESPCGAEGNDAVSLWMNRDLAVHMSRVENGGVELLVVIATTDLDNTPAIRCVRR